LVLAPLVLAQCILVLLPASRGFTGEFRASARPRSIHARASQESSPSSIRAGILVQLDGEPHLVQEVISSEASGPARAKLKNINTGKNMYKTWKNGTTLVHLEKESRLATYSYFDETDSRFVFYDAATVEEFRICSDILGDASRWLVDGTQVDLKLFDGRVIEFGFHGDMIMEVVAKPAGMAVYQAQDSGGWRRNNKDGHKNNARAKQVLLSNGESARGPKYIQVGDRVVVDPHTGSILKRI